MYKKVLVILVIVLTMGIFCGTNVQATTAEITLETEDNQKGYDGRAVFNDKVRFQVALKETETLLSDVELEVILKNHQGTIENTYTADSDIWISKEENSMIGELKELEDGYYTLEVNITDEEGKSATQSTVSFIKDSTKPKVSVKNNLTYHEERMEENCYTGGFLTVTIEEMTFTTEEEAIIKGIETKAEDWNTIIDEETGQATKTITLRFGDEENYQEGDYKFNVTVKDVFERESTYIIEDFVIDYTSPVLQSISYDTESAFHTVGTKDYVNAPTKITFTIKERNPAANHSFIANDKEKREHKWTEIAEDLYTTEVNVPMFGEKGDEQTIMMKIVDKSGNKAVLGKETILRSANNTTFEAGVFTDKFTVDTVAPVIRLEYEKLEPNRFNIEGIDYFNQPVTVKVTIDEHNVEESFFELSIKTTDEDIIYEESEWTGTGDIYVKTFTFRKDNRYDLSVCGTDIAKNPLKIQTVDKVTAINEEDGTVILKTAVDQTLPWIELAAKTTAVNTTIDGQPLYNKDVIYEATVGDPLLNNYASGIHNIRFALKGEDGTSLEYDAGSQLISDVKIASESFNTNGIILSVNAEDVSTNKKAISTKAIAIDTTAPMAEVSYDNNEVSNEKYFHAERTATITVTERNFSDDCFQFLVNGEDQKLEFKLANTGSGNRDDAVWTASYTFASDGDYQVDCILKDRAENPGTVSYRGMAAQDFTVDRTSPVVKIEFDNHNVFHENYYNAQRIATIIVTEHNFDSGDVVIVGTSTDAGVEITYPVLSDWSSNGDEHRATLTFAKDALYTLDVEYKDLAENAANDVLEERFAVDTTDPELTITGVENETPYPDEVRPKIHFSDNNYDRYEAKLIRVEREKSDVNVTEDMIGRIGVAIDATGRGMGGKIIENVPHLKENDGIYTLSVTVYDKAGRQTEKSVTYSVNRFGSVYVYSDDLTALLKGYHRAATGDLFIEVYNADRLLEASTKLEITCDGAKLANQKSQADVKEALRQNTGGWFYYKFRLDSADFINDGRYTITLSDKDEAGNIRTNGDAPIEFYIDKSTPVIESVIGLEEAIVNTDKQTVQYVIRDAIALKSVKIYVNGKIISDIKEFDDLTIYNGEFTIHTGMKQKIRIIIEDKAGNVLDTSEVSFEPAYPFNDEITVSTNFWIRWYANEPLFWSFVAGLAAVIVGGSVWFLLKKKYNKE